MSGAARCLSRLTSQLSRRTTAKRKPRCPSWQTPTTQFRTFSSARSWLQEEKPPSSPPSNTPSPPTSEESPPPPPPEPLTIEDLEDFSRAEFDRSTPEQQQEIRAALRHLSSVDPEASFDDELDAMDRGIDVQVERIDRAAPIVFPEHKPTIKTAGFWADEEDDEFGQVFDDDDEDGADDMTTTAHADLDLHRDMREYQRRIAWDMPLLRKFSKAYPPPAQTSPLRFRYTTYFGENHPSARKVVLEFCPADLPPSLLQTPQQHSKLIKLAGVRYNPSKRLIKLSCEKFETQAQNKRYLGDLVQKLIKEATDPEGDSFEDVPFDFRHHKVEREVRFPDGWRLGGERGAERVRELVRERERTGERRMLEAAAVEEGGRKTVDGDEIVKQYVEAVAAFQASRPIAPVAVGPGAGGRGRGRDGRLLAR